jgi:hypothetical protein
MPPYDTLKDFTHISLMRVAPLFMVAHSSLPTNNVKELIALAKARPGRRHQNGVARPLSRSDGFIGDQNDYRRQSGQSAFGLAASASDFAVFLCAE